MLVSVLLLPLFFALTGMRTRLDLLNDTSMWLWAGIVLLAAGFGKMGGAALAARWTGQSWRDAAALGALLNTRGLVELTALLLTLLGMRGTAKKQPGSVPVSVAH